MNKEIWKNIVGYEDSYEISNFGRIRSKERIIISKDGRKRFLPENILNIGERKHLYKNVCLYKNGLGERFSIHRLVATHFIPNPKNLPYIDHIDGNPSNNHVSNLRWVTQKENMNNPVTKKKCSERVYTDDRNVKILETRRKNGLINKEKEVHQFSLTGEYLQSFKSISEACRITGINNSSIANVCRRGRGGKSAGGFLWSFSKDTTPKYDPYPNNHKVVYRYKPDGAYVDEWYSVADAERSLNIKNISRCARTNSHVFAGGFLWRYYKVDNILKGAIL